MSAFGKPLFLAPEKARRVAETDEFKSSDAISAPPILGTRHNDQLVGTDTADILLAGDGDDSLEGKAGRDILVGGDGDDDMAGGDGGDLLIAGLGGDAFDGGSGFDVVSYRNAGEGVTINLLSGQALGGAEGDTWVNVEGLVGTDFNDSLIGDKADNFLFGLDGDDYVDGGSGNDFLVGGAGADFIHGSEGIDTVSYSESSAPVYATLDQTCTGGDAQGDVLSWIENIIGSSWGDALTGNILVNELSGLSGNDLIHGGAAADILTGGTGGDRFYYGDLSELASQKMSDQLSVTGVLTGQGDVITDFEAGEDRLRFDTENFAGSVTESDSIADLGLATADDTGFLFDDEILFYVGYASQLDFDNGIAEVWIVSELTGVASLGNPDLEFF